MDKLGVNLSYYQLKCFSQGFPLKTVCQIGIQLLDRIQALHKLGILHLDIKPDNICLGKNNQEVNLIDFGLSKRWHNKGLHVPHKSNQPFCGHLIFASRWAALGETMSRRDDICSLVYTLLYLAGRKLPWFDITNRTFEEVGRMKLVLLPE